MSDQDPPPYEPSGSDSKDEPYDTPDDPPGDITRYALIQSLRTEGGSQDFLRSMSMELLLREECDWGALLSHAPRALCSMGHCFVVASSPMTSSIKLTGSTELKYESLRANLVHCSDLGRAAFRQAETKMGKVGMYTQYICEANGPIQRILKALEDDTLAKHDLPRQLQRLGDFAQECVKDAQSVREHFAAWQKKAEEIRRVCTDTEDRANASQRELSVQGTAYEERAKYLERDMAQLKLQSDAAKEDVEFHREQYVKASKPVGNSWESLAKRYAGTVIDSVGTVVEAGASILAANYAMKSSTLGLVAPLISLVSKARPPTPATKPLDDHTDYGFQVAKRLSGQIEQFSQYLGDGRTTNSGPFGMDWRSLSGAGNRSVSVFLKVMASNRDDSQLSPPKNEISSQVISVIHRVIAVAQEIDGWRERDLQIQGGGLKGLDDHTVQRWRREIHDCLAQANALVERGKKAAEDDVTGRERSRSNSKESKLAMIRHYRENFASSQRVLDEAQKRLEERTERERKAQQDFNAIQQELMKLQSETATIDDVKRILGACTRNLGELLQHIDELAGFFSNLYTFVEGTYRNHGRNFIETADGMKALLADAPPETREALKQDRMGVMLMDSLTLRGYYAVMREISGTYVEVSKKYIMPGVNQVDQLSLTDNSTVSQAQIEAKTKQIAAFAETAQQKINELANKRKQLLTNQLVAKRGEAEEIGHMLEQAAATLPSDEAGDASVESLWAS